MNVDGNTAQSLNTICSRGPKPPTPNIRTAIMVDNRIPQPGARSQPAKVPPYRERRRHSHRSKQIRSLQLISLLLAIALVVVFIGWINTWANLNNAELALFSQASTLRQQNTELDMLRSRDKDLSEKISALVQHRLPSLRELKFDVTIQIEDTYVRNISFTRTGVGNQLHYEYSMVLANRNNDILRPNVHILLFDEAGIQTGASKITPDAATSNSDLEFLEPLEIRAYTAQLHMDRPDAAPTYFQVYVE